MFLKRLFLLLLCLPLGLEAQRSAEAGVFVGGSLYQGDLAPTPFYAGDLHLAIGGTYRYLFLPDFGIRGNVSYTKLSGSDINVPRINQRRLWSFSTDLIEFNISAEWHPLSLSRYSRVGLFRRQYTPFIGLGMGIVLADAKVNAQNRDFEYDKENTSTFLTIPVNFGIRFDLSEAFMFQMEAGPRYVLSDYLDSVSPSGGKEANDWYILFGLSMMYIIDAEREDRY